MKIAKAQKMAWEDFLKMLDQTHRKYRPMPLFDHLDKEEK